MANYLVTDTQLTSVANAIRTKSGTNSSLAFPSGFVSAVGNIQGDVWDGLGANPEFVQTIWSENITLADTNWDNVTLTTSSQTIRDRTRILNSADNTNILLNWDYDYALIGEGTIKYTYNNNIYPAILACYNINVFPICTYNDSLSQISLNTQETSSWENLQNTSLALVETSLNNFSISRAQYGIYYEYGTSPSMSYSGGIYSLFTPLIKANISNSTFPQTAADEINKNNTTLSYSWKLYRYKKNSTTRYMRYKNIENRFLADYPQYAPQS